MFEYKKLGQCLNFLTKHLPKVLYLIFYIADYF